jgi:orotidine-5'-phosphate decarboxylase
MESVIEYKDGIDKIIVPLDVPNLSDAVTLVKLLSNNVAMFKIGLELLMSEGITVIHEISKMNVSIFLDTKLHDIPNTVARAAKAIVRQNIAMFNVHISGGFEMMQATVDAVQEESTKLGVPKPLILGVTILTSINNYIMNEQLQIPGTVEEHVVHLAKAAEKAGLDGIIASPHEIKILRENLSGKMLIITPGIRPEWAAAQDQKRIMTPRMAIQNGASYIVIGRPIIKPPTNIGTPVEAAITIAREIHDALLNKE